MVSQALGGSLLDRRAGLRYAGEFLVDASRHNARHEGAVGGSWQMQHGVGLAPGVGGRHEHRLVQGLPCRQIFMTSIKVEAS